MYVYDGGVAVLGVYQPSLGGGGDPAIDRDTLILRHWLDETSWVDVATGWLQGADTLLMDLTGSRLATSPARPPERCLSRCSSHR